MAKRIVAAWVEQIVEFDTKAERDAFCQRLVNDGRPYDVLDDFKWGTLAVRIRKQYNKNNLWKYADDIR